MTENKSCVYMMFDEFNTCLYVGITNNIKRRLHAHKSNKKWFDIVSTIKVSGDLNRNLAHIYEIYYICKLMPLHNIDFINNIDGFELSINEINFNTIYIDDSNIHFNFKNNASSYAVYKIKNRNISCSLKSIGLLYRISCYLEENTNRVTVGYSEMAKMCNVSKSSISKCIRELQEENIIQKQYNGLNVIIYINPSFVVCGEYTDNKTLELFIKET